VIWGRGNLVPRACDSREATRGSGIIRCRKPGILAKIELRIPFQRFLPETDYPRASRSFPRTAGSGNEIGGGVEEGQIEGLVDLPTTRSTLPWLRYAQLLRSQTELFAT
jgi:hypothetical protein